MAKRGRKPSKNKQNYYFLEEQEEAVKNYNLAETKAEKDKIFNNLLRPAFIKMIESIIRRYKLYIPDETFEDTFNDTLSFLMSKIEKFNVERGHKAYSYCGTICKNYLIYRITQCAKEKKRSERLDNVSSIIDNSAEYSYTSDNSNLELLTELISKITYQINTILTDEKSCTLSENERKVGKALIEIMNNWEDYFYQMGSNKFNKSSILLFLKEMTNLSTKEIRDNMKKYKIAYYSLKEKLMSN